MKYLMANVLLVCATVACGGDDAGPGPSGYVFVESYTATNSDVPTEGSVAGASFTSTAVACMEQVFGACTVNTCPGTLATDYISAGVITVSTTPQVALTPDADNRYASQVSDTATSAPGGAAISFSAAGSDVPAFSGSLVMPAKATMQTPAAPTPDTVWDRANDLALAWQGGSGKLQAILSAGGNVSLNCVFDASAGSGTVPKAALAWLPVTTMGSYLFRSQTTKEVAAGDYAITLSGIYDSVWPDDSLATGNVTFQ